MIDSAVIYVVFIAYAIVNTLALVVVNIQLSNVVKYISALSDKISAQHENEVARFEQIKALVRLRKK